MLKKTFIPCFLGGFIGCLISFRVAPRLWFLGAFCGSCVGYLLYDFRETLKAIEKAFVALWRKFVDKVQAFATLWQRYFSDPRPVFFSSLFISTLGYVYLFPWLLVINSIEIYPEIPWIHLWICTAAYWILTPLAIAAVLIRLYESGMEDTGNEPITDREKRQILLAYEEINITSYKLLLKFTFIGSLYALAAAVKGICWLPTVGLYKFIRWLIKWTVIKPLLLPIWKIALRIYSDHRILCGLNCGLGVLVGYLFFSPFATTGTEKAFAILSGGFIAWFVSLLQYKIVIPLVTWIKELVQYRIIVPLVGLIEEMRFNVV